MQIMHRIKYALFCILFCTLF